MISDLSIIDEAELRGYIEFNQNRTRITYHCGRRYTDDFTDPEEIVRAFVYSWLVINKGYSVKRIKIGTNAFWCQGIANKPIKG